MKYFIKTFGCQMNYADSERIRTVFKVAGVEEASSLEEADWIVLNSCAIRQKAEDKLFGHGKQIQENKNSRQDGFPKVIMTGCIVKTGIKDKVRGRSVSSIQKDILNKVKWIDHAVPTKYVFNLIRNLLEKCLVDSALDNVSKDDYLKIAPLPYSGFQASLPISVGCNHHCTFCTVPYSRGKEEFREYKSIKSEYVNYVKNNYKAITLLGQTVNKWLNPNLKYHPKAYGWYRYGEKLPMPLEKSEEPGNFLELLQNLDSIEGEYWLNFVSSYPNYFTKKLIESITDSINANDGHIIPAIHLAVQSGSDSMLEKMYRHYTVEEFREIVDMFRSNVPDICISTDIIVGYPSETQKEFEDTCQFCEEIGFDMIYISEFSARPDTTAENLEDDVKADIKRERKQVINDILEKYLEHKNKKYEGEIHKVLVSDRHHNKLLGKNKYSKDVSITVPTVREKNLKLIGKFVDVKITSSNAWGLDGNLIFR